MKYVISFFGNNERKDLKRYHAKKVTTTIENILFHLLKSTDILTRFNVLFTNIANTFESKSHCYLKKFE